MRLTEHFTIDEFTRTSRIEFQEKNRQEVGPYLQNILKVCHELEELRMFIFRPIYITSGFRCPELNAAVGGAPTSQHQKGAAADFTVKDFQDPQGLQFIFDWCSRHLNYGQLILEKPEGRKPWIHLGLPIEGREKEALIYENGVYRRVEC